MIGAKSFAPLSAEFALAVLPTFESLVKASDVPTPKKLPVLRILRHIQHSSDQVAAVWAISSSIIDSCLPFDVTLGAIDALSHLAIETRSLIPQLSKYLTNFAKYDSRAEFRRSSFQALAKLMSVAPHYTEHAIDAIELDNTDDIGLIGALAVIQSIASSTEFIAVPVSFDHICATAIFSMSREVKMAAFEAIGACLLSMPSRTSIVIATQTFGAFIESQSPFSVDPRFVNIVSKIATFLPEFRAGLLSIILEDLKASVIDHDSYYNRICLCRRLLLTGSIPHQLAIRALDLLTKIQSVDANTFTTIMALQLSRTEHEPQSSSAKSAISSLPAWQLYQLARFGATLGTFDQSVAIFEALEQVSLSRAKRSWIRGCKLYIESEAAMEQRAPLSVTVGKYLTRLTQAAMFIKSAGNGSTQFQFHADFLSLRSGWWLYV